MLFEYALDPSLLNNWLSFRYFYESFGVPQGRLISRYPKTWERLVYEGLDGCGEIERLRIVERLKDIKTRMMNSGRVYEPDRDWLLNAEISHGYREFRAIIASTNPRSREFVLDGGSLDSRNPRWKSETRMAMPRQAREVAQALGLLLQVAQSVVFVDPYFNPTLARFRESLRELVAASRKASGGYPARIELLLRPKSDYTWFERECSTKLSPLLATGVAIHVRILAEVAGGELLHNRYVLTDRGGALLGVGLDQGQIGQLDDLMLMSDTQFHLRWTQYAQGAPAFKSVHEFDVVGR
jgi:hypothetical protein